MARLTAAKRNALPDSAFAGPNRTFPVPDTSHAKAANMDKGKVSASKKPSQAKINAKLGAKSKGKGK
jgi:hypothetical protein